jgi:hypothetical protein
MSKIFDNNISINLRLITNYYKDVQNSFAIYLFAEMNVFRIISKHPRKDSCVAQVNRPLKRGEINFNENWYGNSNNTVRPYPMSVRVKIKPHKFWNHNANMPR